MWSDPGVRSVQTAQDKPEPQKKTRNIPAVRDVMFEC